MDTTNFSYDENNDINLTKNNLKVTVIFPAKNEEGTIESTVLMASRSNYNPEIIVVDAYSNDKTAKNVLIIRIYIETNFDESGFGLASVPST